MPASATTTAEENRHTESQRRINLIWEITQAIIALTVIIGTIGTTVWLVTHDPTSRTTAFTFMVGIVSTVIGFYFGRTNHQRTGGVDSSR